MSLIRTNTYSGRETVATLPYYESFKGRRE
jgi:hypothetical protein